MIYNVGDLTLPLITEYCTHVHASLLRIGLVPRLPLPPRVKWGECGAYRSRGLMCRFYHDHVFDTGVDYIQRFSRLASRIHCEVSSMQLKELLLNFGLELKKLRDGQG